MVVAINIAAVAEALSFAKKAGTDPELVYRAIRGGLAGSTVMDAKAPMMLSRNFNPGFRIELHIKDLNNALNAAHAISSPAPLTAQMMEIMQFLRSEGCDREDHASVVKYYEKNIRRNCNTGQVNDKVQELKNDQYRFYEGRSSADPYTDR